MAGLILGALAQLPQHSLGGVFALTLATLCAALLATMLVSLLAAGSTHAAPSAVSMRRQARGSDYRRLSDPDAAGRPRPRAPGAA
jgi:hypothetical protein